MKQALIIKINFQQPNERWRLVQGGQRGVRDQGVLLPGEGRGLPEGNPQK